LVPLSKEPLSAFATNAAVIVPRMVAALKLEIARVESFKVAKLRP
jgi:hypothetical protein